MIRRVSVGALTEEAANRCKVYWSQDRALPVASSPSIFGMRNPPSFNDVQCPSIFQSQVLEEPSVDCSQRTSNKCDCVP